MREARSIFSPLARILERGRRRVSGGGASPSEGRRAMRFLVVLLGLIEIVGSCRSMDSHRPPTPPEAHVAAEPIPPPTVISVESATTEMRSSTTEVRRSTTSSSSIVFTNGSDPPQDLWSEDAAPEKRCCRVCRVGKACGNTCIARNRVCHTPPGCACDL